MRKFIAGLVLGLMFTTGVAYGYRIAKPLPINEINPNTLVELNAVLEKLWNITNGRYTPETTSSAPTIAAGEGDLKVYSSGGVYRIYIYLNDGWRVWSSD